MTNPQKIKGTNWERVLAKQLGEHAEVAKRIPGSGALGTTLGDSRLTGDVYVKYKFMPRSLKIEAKYGYGGSTQMTIKRLWMTKVREESSANNSIPAVAIKFRDVTGGDTESSKWICFTVEDWNGLVKYLNELFDDLEGYWEYKYGKTK
jgi:Holliday junction resolvase